MSRQAALPLNSAAVEDADDQFYANHPELVQNGQRIPLDTNDPAQAGLRSEWMDLYEANGGRFIAPKPAKKKPADTSQPCPSQQAQLAIFVLDPNGNPIPGATVTADGLTAQTNQQGIADFGRVDPKTYEISA